MKQQQYFVGCISDLNVFLGYKDLAKTSVVREVTGTVCGNES